jgi:hypothetical protein
MILTIIIGIKHEYIKSLACTTNPRVIENMIGKEVLYVKYGINVNINMSFINTNMFIMNKVSNL